MDVCSLLLDCALGFSPSSFLFGCKGRGRAQVAVRLESEVASLQQTLEDRMQHGHKCDGQLAALRRQVSVSD